MKRTTKSHLGLVIALLMLIGSTGCSQEHGIEIDEIEFYSNENPVPVGPQNISLDKRFLQSPTRYIHAGMHVEYNDEDGPTMTCTLINPRTIPVDSVQKVLEYHGRQPSTGKWFTNVVFSFGPLDRDAPFGFYRVDCKAEDVVATGSFELARMEPAELMNEVRSGIVLIRTLAAGEKLFVSDPSCRAAPFGHGTGFVIDPTGYILTNNHVVDPCPVDWPHPKLQVKFADGRTTEPVLVGQDPLSDLALLKVERTDLHVFNFMRFDHTQAKVGDDVLAIGYAAGIEGEPTISRGIVSAYDRSMGTLADMVQTDAAINHGNSGGPLISMRGDVVGINTLIVGRDEGMEGLNFAVSGSLASRIVSHLKASGKVRRGYLGITNLIPISETASIAQELEGRPFASGILVAEVDPFSPADLGGLKPCDVIEQLDTPDGRQIPIRSIGDFHNALLWIGPEETVFVRYRRYPLGKCDAEPTYEGYSWLHHALAQQDKGEAQTAKVVLR